RVDNGYVQGMEVPIHYDPMLAKLIAHGRDREEAMARLLRAIGEFQVKGVSTTLPFGAFVLAHPAFRSGNFDTHFLGEHYRPELIQKEGESQAEVAALVALFRYLEDKKTVRLPKN